MFLFPPMQQRLHIKAQPKKGNMYMFHLIIGHNGETYPEIVSFMKMIISNELEYETLRSMDDLPPRGDFGNFYLKYEFDLERVRSFFTTLDRTPLTMITRSHKKKSLATSPQP